MKRKLRLLIVSATMFVLSFIFIIILFIYDSSNNIRLIDIATSFLVSTIPLTIISVYEYYGYKKRRTKDYALKILINVNSIITDKFSLFYDVFCLYDAQFEYLGIKDINNEEEVNEHEHIIREQLENKDFRKLVDALANDIVLLSERDVYQILTFDNEIFENENRLKNKLSKKEQAILDMYEYLFEMSQELNRIAHRIKVTRTKNDKYLLAKYLIWVFRQYFDAKIIDESKGAVEIEAKWKNKFEDFDSDFFSKADENYDKTLMIIDDDIRFYDK